MIDLLATPDRRKLLFATLYLSEGAPIGFIWYALPTRLRVAEVSIEQITWLTAVLVLPWTFKFLWAPLVDTLRSDRWGRKQWIIAAQLLMSAALVPLFWIDIQDDFPLLVTCLLLHAFAAATQDVAIDALCIAVTHPAERGRINGWMQSGMLVGRSFFGGGALVMAAYLHENVVIALLIAATLSSLVLLLPARERRQDGRAAEESAGRWSSFSKAIRSALRQPNTWLGLAFAATGAAAAEAVGVVAGPYLADRGFSEAQIGWFLAVPMIVAMIAGSLSGGWLADRWGHRRAVVGAQGLIIAALLGLALADWQTAGQPGSAAMILLTAVFFGFGVYTAASYALFMDITTHAVAATQFSAYMGGVNACESWSSFTVGRLIGGFGYPLAFAVMSGLSVLALPLVLLLRGRRSAVELKK